MTTPSPRGPNTYFDETIVRRYRAGLNTVAIADKLKMSRHFVRTRLIANGVDMSVRQTGHKISDIWSMDDDERRVAIAQHAARGARAALDQISANLPGVNNRENSGKAIVSAFQSGTFEEQRTVTSGEKSPGREPRRHTPQPVFAARASSTVSERTAQR